MRHPYFPLFRWAIASVAIALLAGCFEPTPTNSGMTTTTLTITPSLGMVRNATVVVRNVAGVTVGSGSTGATGVARVAVTGNAPFVVEVRGNADADYFDENLGAFIAFPTGSSIHALVPAGVTVLGVTGLTELAHALLRSQASLPLNNHNILVANQAIRIAFVDSPRVGSILDVPHALAATPGSGELGDNTADTYAVILAALADLGQGQAAPALAVIAQLRDDLADGDIDGQNIGGALPGTLLYAPATLPTALRHLIDIRRNLWGDSALQTAALLLQNLSQPAWSGPDVVGSTQPAHPNAALSMSRQLQFQRAADATATLPFTNNEIYTVDLSSTGELTVNGITYRFPYLRNANEQEINWASGLGFEFVLSNNMTGIFSTLVVRSTQELTDGQGVVLGSFSMPPLWSSHATLQTLDLNAIAWGNGVFVAVGNNKKILVSTDGLVWTAGTPPTTPGDWTKGTAIVFDGSQFVMVGDTTDPLVMPPLIATSTDGLAWTYRHWTPASSVSELNDVAAADGRITVVGPSATVASSTDGGEHWSNETQSLHLDSFDIAASDTARVIIGGGSPAGTEGLPINHILVDTGAGWTSALLYTLDGYYFYDAVWAGTQFVAVGYTRQLGGSTNPASETVFATSPDGATWTIHNYTKTQISGNFKALAWDGTRIYTAGNYGTDHVVYSSTDMTNWSEEYRGAVAGSSLINGMVSSPSNTIAVGPMKLLIRH